MSASTGLGVTFLSSGGKHVLPPVQVRQSRSQTSGIQGADRSDQLQRLRLRAALGALPECCRAASHYLRLDRQQPRDHPARRIAANIAKLPELAGFEWSERWLARTGMALTLSGGTGSLIQLTGSGQGSSVVKLCGQYLSLMPIKISHRRDR